jgi:23S rRNA (adenine2503-C2)-methyltransferase
MGCKFCASAQGGLVRNLTAGEMLSQIYDIGAECGERISHIVIMGMGEPLDNYHQVIRFIRMVSDPIGYGISQRNITLSTCGLTDAIRCLAKEHLAVTLAVSLHAPNDAIRKQIMPTANRYPVDEILEVCDEYLHLTGRRVTYEYSLIDGVNDRREHAELLSEKLKGRNCHVNCIRLNEVKGHKNNGSSLENITNFKKILEKNRINVTIRRGMGSDIEAACGQLRKKYLDNGQDHIQHSCL